MTLPYLEVEFLHISVVILMIYLVYCWLVSLVEVRPIHNYWFCHPRFSSIICSL